MQHRIPMQTRRDYKVLGPFTMAGLGTVGIAGVIDLGWVRLQPWPIPLRLALGLVIALMGVGAALIRWPPNDGGDLPLTWAARMVRFYFSEASTPRRFWSAGPRASGKKGGPSS